MQEKPPLDEACRHFCFAKPTQYDVMLQNKKIAGAAQRRKKNGYLHQGSISLVEPDPTLLSQVLKGDTQVFKAMRSNTHYLLKGPRTEQELNEAKERLKELLVKTLMENNS